MKRNKILIGLCITAIFCLQALVAQANVISAKELAKIMENDNVRVISARDPKDYGQVHIKNAINIWHKDLYKEGEIKALIKSPEELAKIFGEKGIAKDNTIVIYDKGDNKFAGRLYWILDYLGCNDVRILDGHMKQWRKAKMPVTKEITKVKPTTFNPSPGEEKIASTKYVKDHLKDKNVVLVDARSKEEYDGEKGETERLGHLPGAISFEFKNVVGQGGTIKSKEELQKVTKEAGITSDKEIIIYCESSVRAGIVYMALKSILEFPKVRVYDGAFNEWVADPSNPLE
ncbi:MAG: sulfurtransferase [Deltaproteobacteria bacterium]|nr:sulfurtransferase [Deltaproteobacteria bacterium]